MTDDTGIGGHRRPRHDVLDGGVPVLRPRNATCAKQGVAIITKIRVDLGARAPVEMMGRPGADGAPDLYRRHPRGASTTLLAPDRAGGRPLWREGALNRTCGQTL